MALKTRSFPFVPSSSLQLEVGDFWAVELNDGNYGCMAVVELKRSGVGSRSTFIAGVVDWRGTDLPSVADLDGRPVLDRGLTGMSVFSEGGATVLGNASVYIDPTVASHFAGDVGHVAKVRGWKALPTAIERVFGEGHD